MKKIEIKTKEVYSKDEMKRYLGSLHENYMGKLDVLAEGIKIISKKQDQHTKILDSHTEILDQHTKILDSHTEMIGVLMEDVSILKEDVSILKEDMQIVKKEIKKKVDYDEFISLVQRVSKIEAKI